MMRRRLACCTRDKEISLDFDEQEKERIMTYNGLETCIINSESYENESGRNRVGDGGCPSSSLDEDDSSCSSSNNAFGSFSSHWMTTTQRDEGGLDEWEASYSPQCYYVKEKPDYTIELPDVETMKERFGKILLGEDVTGGQKGVSAALALSNAITNLAASVFGELWKLEPLSEERKSMWKREMDWFLSPTNYMIELVPAKQNGSNGRTMEIMTPRARADIHMILPALKKLDSMLIETLNSMVDTEFWYGEGGSSSRGEDGRSRSKRWWLPSPQVPVSGLSHAERKKLLYQGKTVHQVLKAARSINHTVLLEMPVPDMIKNALPKSQKGNLGEELYKILSTETVSTVDMFKFMNLKTEHQVLDDINRLEAAILVWKEKIITEQEGNNGKSPARRTSWSPSFIIKDPISEMDKMAFISERAEALLQQLKNRYLNLPQTFLDVTKIRYGKDVGHAILEAYSRVIGNLAFSIVSRIGDILQEDVISSNPNSPVPAVAAAAACNFFGFPETPVHQHNDFIRHPLVDKSNAPSDLEINSVSATPSRVQRIWCIGIGGGRQRESCSSSNNSMSPKTSPPAP